MSSAKAALESDTRVLAYEAGRKYGRARQLYLGWSNAHARREGHRDYRRDGRLLPQEFPAG